MAKSYEEQQTETLVKAVQLCKKVAEMTSTPLADVVAIASVVGIQQLADEVSGTGSQIEMIAEAIRNH